MYSAKGISGSFDLFLSCALMADLWVILIESKGAEKDESVSCCGFHESDFGPWCVLHDFGERPLAREFRVSF